MPARASALIAGKLSARFRAGMRPLAIGTALVVAASAPTATLLIKRHDLRRQALIYANQIAGLVRQTAEERGDLWRYDTPKLSQALQSVQGRESETDITSIEIFDASGRPVISPEVLWPESPGPTFAGEAPLIVNGEIAGRARVTVSSAAAWRDAGTYGLVFGLLGLALGLAMYLFPLRLFREEDLVRVLIGRSLRAAEEERLRISRELHDGVGQAIGAGAAQEALANVARHARARRARVNLAATGALIALRVEDDGCGFAVAETMGLGLLGARERVAQLRGSLQVMSAPGRGTRLWASLPMELL